MSGVSLSGMNPKMKMAGGFAEIFVEGFHAAIEAVTVVTGIEPAYDQHFTRWL